MGDKNFKGGDLVWAKMKGYPPWPAQVIERDKAPFKKSNHHYVYFFGSKNHAWILDENITPHSPNMILDYEKKLKPLKSLINAIADFTDYIKTQPPTLTSDEKLESSSEKSSDNERCSESSSSDESCSDERIDDEFIEKMMHQTRTENAPNLDNTLPQSSRPAYTYVAPTEKKIGFLGLELMGRYIVKNLLKSGHDVTVWNRKIQHLQSDIAGAQVCLTPKDVVQKCDIIFCCVDASETPKFPLYGKDGVLDGLKDCGSTKGYVEMTPLGEEASKDIAEAINYTGAKYLEVVPIDRTLKLVEDGELIICASGDKTLFNSCLTVFHTISKEAFYISEEVGKAATYGLAFSLFSGTVSAGLGEGMTLAHYTQIPKIEVVENLGRMGFQSNFLKQQSNSIMESNFEPSIVLRELQKEMSLALQMADETHAETPLSASANQIFIYTKNIGYGLKDASAVYMGSLFGYTSKFLKQQVKCIKKSIFEPSIVLRELQKEMSLALQIADETHAETPLSASANQIFIYTKMIGYGLKDASAVYMGSMFGYTSKFLKQQVKSIKKSIFEPSIVLRELQKEMSLALQIADETYAETPVSASANQLSIHSNRWKGQDMDRIKFMIGYGLKDASAVYMASKS